MKIRLPYPPSANRYWRTDRRGLPHLSDEAKDYKRLIAQLYLSMPSRPVPLEGAVALHLMVYRPRKSGDLSNRIKVLEDVLQGFAYEDDSQVVELHAFRFEDKANPRVEVTVSPFVPHDTQS